MLWFDNDPQIDIRVKIDRAILYYQKKYGQTPDLCYVHPSMLAGKLPISGGVDVQPDQMILESFLDWFKSHLGSCVTLMIHR